MYDSKAVAPTSEWALAGGSTSDDARDSDVDLTVDLGFHSEREGCFYLPLTDTDRDGVPLIQWLTGTTLGTNLVFGGSIANIDRAQFAYDTRTQRLDVQYIFNQWGGKKVAGFYGMLINNLSASNSMSTNVLAVPATYAQWQFDHDGTLLDYALASPFRLKSSALGAHWALQTDTTLADAGSTILAPGEGVLVHSRSTEITLPVSGEVRAWNFVSTLRAGSQLIGSGHPLDQSPASMSMTSSAGFSPDADRLQIWNGDSTMTRHAFRRTHAGTAWFDSKNIETTHERLLPAFRAIFLTIDQSIPSWIMKPQ